MNEDALQLVERYNRLALDLEEQVVDRVDRALDAAYRNLEREFLKQYPAIAANTNLLPSQRRAVLMNDLSSLLQVIRSDDGYQQQFEQLIQRASSLGGELGGKLIEAIAPGSFVRAFAAIPIEAVALQARDGVQRLYRYNDEFRNKASAIVEQGLIQGWGAQRSSRLLREELGTTKYQAERIIRTETLSALNDGAQLRYQRHGVDGVQWCVTRGEVCPFCIARNMQVYETGRVRVPAHPFCLVPGTNVSAPAVLASTERKYIGDVIVIQTASGKELTVTPNHPILTPQGWLAAELVVEGSDVFSCIDSERVTRTIAPHKYNRPSAIEEIVAAFSKSSGVSSVSMEVAPEYFHGDGIGSKVCVVSTNSLLSNEFNAKTINQFLELPFDGGLARQTTFPSDRLPTSSLPSRSSARGCLMCSGNLIESLPLSHLAPLQRLSLRLRANRSPRIFKHSANRGTLNLELLRQSIFRDTRTVEADNLVPDISMLLSESLPGPFVFELLSCLGRSHQSPLLQNTPEQVGVEMDELSSVLDRFAGLIQRDRVVKTFRKSFDGHVYNLETQTGWYFANDILTHNCRCVLLPWKREWQELRLTDDEFAQSYANDRLADLRKQGKEPNSGLTPFERMAGLDKPPTPIWTPGQQIERREDTKQKRAATKQKREAEITPDSLRSALLQMKANILEERSKLQQERDRLLDEFRRTGDFGAAQRAANLTDQIANLDGKFIEEGSKIVAETANRYRSKFPVSVKEHGMTDARDMYRFTTGAYNWHAIDFAEDSKAVRTILETLSLRQPLPDRLVQATENIYFSDQRNSSDPYWEKKYNRPGFVSAATAGDGNVVYYPAGSGVETLSHEMGHNLARRLYGSTDPDSNSAYAKAAQKDGRHPSDYGNVAIAEDFAESVKMYLFDQERLRAASPSRFAEIERLLQGR